jgi:hypothetical protein
MILCAVLLVGPASAAVILGPVTNPANGHNYYLLSQSSWTAAEAEATTLGGHLATINDQAENDFIFNAFAALHPDDDLWIGTSDAATEGQFEWVNGEATTFTNWACCIGGGAEPNNLFGDDYGVIWRWAGGLGGQWADLTDSAINVPNSTPYGVVETSMLLLWNKLGSSAEIESSAVGLDGTFGGGGSVPGVFGNALLVNHAQESLVSFPKEVLLTDAGTVEFWAKLSGFPADIGWEGHPDFFIIHDHQSTFSIGLNGNNGAGSGGLTGGAGINNSTGTGSYGSYTYEQVLGTGEADDWHHYALVWDKTGIAGVADGSQTVAVFLDGEQESGRWQYFGNSAFEPLAAGELVLVDFQKWGAGETVAMDNLITWGFAKTDFSDRFTEEPGIGCSTPGGEPGDSTPRGLKAAAAGLLQALPPSGHNSADDDIADAIASIQASLESELWLDDDKLFYNEIYITHGKEVFDEERAAASSLEDVLAHTELDASTLGTAADVMVSLLLADYELAVTAIEAAYSALGTVDCTDSECNCGDASNDMDDAEAHFANANGHVENDDEDADAIYDYGKAWGSANRSLYETGWCMAKLGSSAQTVAEDTLVAATAAALAAGCDLGGSNTDDGDCRCVKAVDNVDDAEVHLAQGLDKLASGDLEMAEYRFRQTYEDTVKVQDAVHWCE